MPEEPAAAAEPDASKNLAELQVSAHLMTLDTGLFCLFQPPGGPPRDALTGLPAVQVTPPPGSAARPGAVSISTFREDGWLNDSAALVRVTDRSAQVLVTIYQSKGQDAAPRLQILRLNGDPIAGAQPHAANVAAPPADVAEAAPPPEVVAHVQRIGDVGCMTGEWIGIRGSRQWLEGFGITPAMGIAPDDIEYQALLGRNWLSPWVEGGTFCGSRGMALPLLGLNVRLKGAAAKSFECSYTATFVDGSQAGPVKGGELCEAKSLAALEAFEINIHPRSPKAATGKRGVASSRR